MTKLTKAQQELLDELDKPGAVLHYMAGGIDQYWFVSTTMKRCTSTAEALLKKGLIEVSRAGRIARKVK